MTRRSQVDAPRRPDLTGAIRAALVAAGFVAGRPRRKVAGAWEPARRGFVIEGQNPVSRIVRHAGFGRTEALPAYAAALTAAGFQAARDAVIPAWLDVADTSPETLIARVYLQGEGLLTLDFAARQAQAQTITTYTLDGRTYKRRPWNGPEKPEYIPEDGDLSCGDCGVAVGQLHVPCCDLEDCPKCDRQFLSCHYDDWCAAGWKAVGGRFE